MRLIGGAAWTSCLAAGMVSCLALLASGGGNAAPAHKPATESKAVHIRSTAAQNNNREPINIEAAKLDYFDKQQKLIYRGHVVAVRGDTTLKTPMLIVYLNPKTPGAPKGPPSADSQVRRMEAMGPVTIIARGQIATGDAGTYEKAENKIYLNGNVTLSQGPNVTKGDRLVYDTTTGQAVVTGHVRSMFLPDNNNGAAASDEAQSKTAPATAGQTEPASR